MKVLDVPIDAIIVDNRAREDYGNLEELAANLRKTDGVIQPITVSRDLRLLAGGRRLAASRVAGFSTIAAVIRELDDEANAKEIELFENIYRKDLTWQERAKLEREIYELKKASEGWNQEKLAEVLGQSKGAINRHVQLGKALEALPELGQFKSEDDAWKAIKRVEEKILLDELRTRAEAKSRDGGVNAFTFAERHYQIGDAIEGMDELISLGGAKWNFAEVDPPYGIDLPTVTRKVSEVHDLDEYVEVSGDDYGAFIERVSHRVYGLLEYNSHAIFWFAPRHFSLVKGALEKAGFDVHDIPGIWYKGGVGQTMQPAYNLASSYEPFFIARKGTPILLKQGRSNVFEFAPVSPSQKVHKAQRPIELIRELLDTFVYPGARVLVPFLGSGATLRACYQAKMIGYGWDLNEESRKHFIAQVADDFVGVPSKEGDNEGTSTSTKTA